MTNRTRAVVLLSGGLDSAYNLWRAPREYDVVLALTFDYGQRAAVSEIRAAQNLCARQKVEHRVVALPWFRDFTQTSLLNRNANVPMGSNVQIDEFARSQKTAQAVWVPNRNGIFLNIAAAYAEGLGAEVVLTGFNAEEAVTFPDNSVAFGDAITSSLYFSTANHVRVESFCARMTKTDIVREALQAKMPLELVWPCYFSGNERCHACESCQRFDRALRAAGLRDSGDEAQL